MRGLESPHISLDLWRSQACSDAPGEGRVLVPPGLTDTVPAVSEPGNVTAKAVVLHQEHQDGIETGDILKPGEFSYPRQLIFGCSAKEGKAHLDAACNEGNTALMCAAKQNNVAWPFGPGSLVVFWAWWLMESVMVEPWLPYILVPRSWHGWGVPPFLDVPRC